MCTLHVVFNRKSSEWMFLPYYLIHAGVCRPSLEKTICQTLWQMATVTKVNIVSKVMERLQCGSVQLWSETIRLTIQSLKNSSDVCLLSLWFTWNKISVSKWDDLNQCRDSSSCCDKVTWVSQPDMRWHTSRWGRKGLRMNDSTPNLLLRFPPTWTRQWGREQSAQILSRSWWMNWSSRQFGQHKDQHNSISIREI